MRVLPPHLLMLTALTGGASAQVGAPVQGDLHARPESHEYCSELFARLLGIGIDPV